MNNGQIRDLCLRLLRAETENGVVGILTEDRVRDDRKVWRFYGDVENNWGQGGNQQSLARPRSRKRSSTRSTHALSTSACSGYRPRMIRAAAYNS